MDICVLNPLFYPYTGGTERVLLEVYSRLAKKHNITVITSALKTKKGYNEEIIKGIRVVRLRTTHIDTRGVFPMPFFVMHGIRDAISNADAQVYHINNRYQYFYGSLSLIKEMRRKLVLTLHNSLPRNIGPITDSAGLTYDVIWGRKLMHASDLITGVSNSTIKTTVPAAEMYKAHVIYNGVDGNIFKPTKSKIKNGRLTDSAKSQAKLVLTTGRLIPQKGQIYLIRAIARLVEQGVDTKLLILGKGKLQNRLYKEAKIQGIKDRVVISSADSEKRLVEYYNSADLFALPSLYEPASVAILEALSCCLPCTASRTGGIPEMMRDAGVYFKPKEVDGIASSILKIISDEKMTRKMTKRGRALMLKYHNWNNIAKQYERSFESLVDH